MCIRDSGDEGARIRHKVVSYYDRMPDLLAAADLLVGRSGAVSVAEYAVAGVPSICMPYPHHKDRHQYLNAGKLVEVGAAVIVDDVSDADDRAAWLWEELESLLRDDVTRSEMAAACKLVAKPNAASDIAERLIALAERSGGWPARSHRQASACRCHPPEIIVCQSTILVRVAAKSTILNPDAHRDWGCHPTLHRRE